MGGSGGHPITQGAAASASIRACRLGPPQARSTRRSVGLDPLLLDDGRKALRVGGVQSAQLGRCHRRYLSAETADGLCDRGCDHDAIGLAVQALDHMLRGAGWPRLI